MNYFETVQWIFNRLPIYQNIGLKSYKPGLKRIQTFCSYLGNPQNCFKSIHVGGTNGKGSTVHMLSSILQEEKYNVGWLTSPHLVDFRERISCNGLLIEKDFIIDFIKDNKKIIEKEQISFFEMNTALAFQYFKEKKIYIAVIEVGMGGLLDSTNIICPEISVITNISEDHTEILGKDLLEIALAKAGIIKKNISVLIGNRISNNIKLLFLKEALKKNSPIYFSKYIKDYSKYQIPLEANYQNFNKIIVLNTIDILQKKKNVFVSNKSIRNGLKNVIKNTNLKGRWHILRNNPKIICDIAHNEDGFFMVSNQLKKESYQNLHLVLGFVKEKKVEKLLKYFPTEAFYYFCQPNIERKFPIHDLKILVKRIFNKNKKVNFFTSVKKAFLYAQYKSKKRDLILISGSTFVVSEVLILNFSLHLENKGN
ncbi:MAG: bifunctional folylpolyglutamate synthase/dihydrofolate synthase [Flavobacteriales bacterium]|jgi:dihydrofolate synthase/folylpolyglutamate synthase|uniref:bifunctional folylpolyglutamate synthase/dihydrofolate synthase n=1 Tax=Blattabacterium sp. (Mastotermes darwiniensis) TaxID=39768 RepID=UPI000231DEA6|nr:Mur ligase family protein [Blattabacterium sp. (Mastotermes darwiniensis)]AER40730.1 putative folylpolyglutamate synthase [Blattabacterium sp. (Mastotermes darwiniensis) str. MADAR]MDR1805113.1 bifunctional folylpolyglutamate synthase/dihydrofolate synthase [Flavobacteriales bacterium]